MIYYMEKGTSLVTRVYTLATFVVKTKIDTEAIVVKKPIRVKA